MHSLWWYVSPAAPRLGTVVLQARPPPPPPPSALIVLALFLTSFVPYFLPKESRPAIYTDGHVRSLESRVNRRFLNGADMDTIPWETLADE